MNNKDTTNIYLSYVTEARRLPEQKVEGLNDFIIQIDDAKQEKVSYDLLMDLMDIIDKSGCPKIMFDRLHGAMGISKGDACIVNVSVLSSSLPRMLYIILHEVAHQFQYTKHGEEFVHDIYFGEKDDVESAKELLRIENIADRYAIRMLKYLLDKHNIDHSKYDLVPFYKGQSPIGVSFHIEKLRSQIKSLNLTNVHEVSDLMYNSLKKEIALPNYTRTSSWDKKETHSHEHYDDIPDDELDDEEQARLQAELDKELGQSIDPDQLNFGFN